MSIATAAILDGAGLVINMAAVNLNDTGGTDWEPGDGLSAVVLPDDSPVTFGWTWDGATWTAAPPPLSPEV